MMTVVGNRLLLILPLILLLLPQPSYGQSSRSDWGNVRGLKVNSKLLIVTKTGKKIEGKMTGASAESISIAVADASGQTMELNKEEIAEVRKKSAARTIGYAALLGAAGLGAGSAAGFGIGEATEAEGPAPDIIGAAVGLGAGIVIGSVIGGRGQLIYKSP